MKSVIYRICSLALVLAFAIYIGTYAQLSRCAFAASRQYGIDGFWFVVPLTDESKLQNRKLNQIFWIAIQIDCLLGTGMPALCDPMTLAPPDQESLIEDQ